MTVLDVDRIRSGVAGSAFDGAIYYLSRVDSTNRVARDLLTAGASENWAVFTDYQEAGRGRRGRVWLAPPESSLLVSLTLPKPANALSSDFVLLAGLAVAEAIEEVVELAADLKWPNDVLMAGKKVSGILAENVWDGATGWIVLGIGINVNFDPLGIQGMPDTATSIQNEAGAPVSREDLAIALIQSCSRWVAKLHSDQDAVFRTWSGRLSTLGRPVTVYDAGRQWDGTAVGLQRDGSLLVRDSAGVVQPVYAADVSVRPG